MNPIANEGTTKIAISVLRSLGFLIASINARDVLELSVLSVAQLREMSTNLNSLKDLIGFASIVHNNPISSLTSSLSINSSLVKTVKWL